MAHMLFQFNFSMILSIYILSIFFFIYIQDSKGFSITPARPPRHRLPLQLIAERRMATLNRQRSTMNRMRPLSMDIQMLLTHHLKTTGPTTDLRKTKVRYVIFFIKGSGTFFLGGGEMSSLDIALTLV